MLWQRTQQKEGPQKGPSFREDKLLNDNYFGVEALGVVDRGAVVPEGRGRLAEGADGAGAATPEDLL
jgi:hypothetical protein